MDSYLAHDISMVSYYRELMRVLKDLPYEE